MCVDVIRSGSKVGVVSVERFESSSYPEVHLGYICFMQSFVSRRGVCGELRRIPRPENNQSDVTIERLQLTQEFSFFPGGSSKSLIGFRIVYFASLRAMHAENGKKSRRPKYARRRCADRTISLSNDKINIFIMFMYMSLTTPLIYLLTLFA